MRRTSAVILFLLSLGGAALAQGGLGSITGQVHDPSGKVIPGAKIVVTNVATGVQSEAVAGEEGSYQILQLPPGTYSLDVEAAGFKKLQRPNIVVQVSDRLTIDLPLEVGLTSETVTVTEEAPLLRREDAQLGEVIDQTAIQNLPQLNRDPLELLRLAGNVQGGGGRADEGSDTRINGGRTQGIEYFVDGVAQSTGRGHGVSTTTPTMEGVQEFKVITNGIAAEYGRVSGGAVEVVSRSGGNDFHGQLFEYLQNPVLNANSWFGNRVGAERTEFRRNRFGGAVSGPILLPRFGEGGPSMWSGRNRSFFFFNYEGHRFSEAGVPRLASVPTVAERNGDLTGTLVNGVPALMYDPFGRSRVVAPGLPNAGSVERLDLLGGDGKHVPVDRISPVSRAILNYVPLPNRPAVPGNSYRDNYLGFSDVKFNSDTWALRLDHAFTDNSRIFGRYQRYSDDFEESRWRGPLQAIPNNFVDGAFGATINYDWTISPSLIFNARIGGHYNPRTNGSTLPEDFNSGSIPFDAVTRSFLGPQEVPTIQMAGPTEFSNQPRVSVANSTTFNPSVSMIKILDRHTVKFGYEHRRYYDNFSATGEKIFSFQQNPVYRYSIDEGWTDQAFANVMGSFLLGINNRAQIIGDTSRSMNYNYNGAYVQDDWKVTPKLSLNLGVRWDMETPASERYDKLYLWDKEAPSPFTIKPGWTWEGALRAAGLDPARVRRPEWLANGFPKGAIRVANTPEYPSRLGGEWNPWQFAPRFGFAYSPNDSTVIRGSFAKMYLSTSGDPGGYSTGGGAIALTDAAIPGWHRGLSTNYADAISTFANPYIPTDITRYVRDNRVANSQATGGDPAAAGFDIDSRMPREYTWSLGIQRELPGSFLVEAYYSANIGRGLLARDLVSRFPKELFVPEQRGTYVTAVETPFAEPTRYGETMPLGLLEYQYPYYGPAQILATNLGRSNYHAMNLRAERRLGRSFSFLANYTLGKLLDNVGGPNGQNDFIVGGGTGAKAYQTVDTVRDAYGISPLDERHRLSLYYSALLPFGEGRRFLSDTGGLGRKLVDYVVGGWELSGISLWRSGRPLIISHGNVNNNPLRIEATFWRSLGSLANPNRPSNSDLFNLGADPVRQQQQDPQTAAVGVFSASDQVLAPPALFTYGDVNVLEDFRQPSRFSHDLSLMKRFRVFSESRYLQLRVEAENILNMRGFGDIDANPDSRTFGLITGPASSVGFGQGLRFDARRLQVSARFVF